jgi:signal transduction histidine kinase
LIEHAQLEEEEFTPASEKLRGLVGTAAKAAQVHVDQRKRLQTLISELSVEVTKSIQVQATDTKQIAEERESQVRQLAQAAIVEMKDTIDGVRAELQRVNFSDFNASAVEKLKERLQGKIDSVARRQQELLENAKQQLVEMKVGGANGDELVISAGEITGAIEEEVLALRESADADAELVQLGMALAVVTHEFDAVIRAIRGELGRLRRWAVASPQLMPIYQRINGNFEHLDGYLALFTPLQRRLYRKPQSISGSEIAKFLGELFDERMKRHSISLVSTDEFCRKTVVGYPSTFFPVFVNLVDNAIYWLKNNRQPRTITLAVEGEGILIANNGPKIAARDREAIFDLRFTRKPSGRGLGLYISRNTLAKAGYELTLVKKPEFSVCFQITQRDLGSEDSDES